MPFKQNNSKIIRTIFLFSLKSLLYFFKNILLNLKVAFTFISRLILTEFNCTRINIRPHYDVFRSTKLLNIERLLLIAERYVLVVEEHHTSARTILPHGASFHGYPMALSVISESPKMEFTLQVDSCNVKEFIMNVDTWIYAYSFITKIGT